MNTPPHKPTKSTSATSSNPESLNSDIAPSEDPASAIIDVPAVEVPELTPEEQSDRLHLERRVERAFFEAGKALAELRDRRLYRSTHKTFEEYCRDRFGHSRQKSNYLIAASQVYENLTTICCQNSEVEDLTTNGTQILPTSEGQVRPMTKLESQQQWEVWQTAVEEAGGKVPTGRVVKNAVQRIMERTKIPNTYQVGEVCQILVKDNPDLRGKAGCWAIVAQVNDFSCTVKTWNGEVIVGVQHLRSFNYLPQECQQMQEVCDRIRGLRESENLEEAGRAVLKYLGEMKRPYLTAFEQELLSFLEANVHRKDD
ncbi:MULTISPECIES: hypothetical protein [unclassified Nostoc]|uniref:hypothetical protein n=1 Tax=unclassified Nostoc TaxID=2593658 RepID=UPI001685BF23|nr:MULTISPECIES: hypothetical protein [unclassified Nostoc]MBD2302824.1 hypothetical protein [Nostoc sp. FACHB-190]MBD2498820.1 hypothetical protein [Nostoc sp. FACHB-280]